MPDPLTEFPPMNQARLPDRMPHVKVTLDELPASAKPKSVIITVPIKVTVGPKIIELGSERRGFLKRLRGGHDEAKDKDSPSPRPEQQDGERPVKMQRGSE
eukprot:5696489-Pyramimonas_sp.AAC.2